MCDAQVRLLLCPLPTTASFATKGPSVTHRTLRPSHWLKGCHALLNAEQRSHESGAEITGMVEARQLETGLERFKQ